MKKVIELANEFHMPIHIGTEGNKVGLPFVDELDGTDLKPFKSSFIKGARILIGHAVLSRFADYAYAGDRADAEFPDVKAKNAFFETVGALPAVNSYIGGDLREMGPVKALDALRRVGETRQMVRRAHLQLNHLNTETIKETHTNVGRNVEIPG